MIASAIYHARCEVVREKTYRRNDPGEMRREAEALAAEGAAFGAGVLDLIARNIPGSRTERTRPADVVRLARHMCEAVDFINFGPLVSPAHGAPPIEARIWTCAAAAAIEEQLGDAKDARDAADDLDAAIGAFVEAWAG